MNYSFIIALELVFVLFAAVKFSKGLRNTTVPEGSDVYFKVEIANNDVDGVIWEKNGLAVADDGRKFVIKASLPIFTLTIKAVTKEDEAAYTCRIGSAKTTARLYVEG